MKSHVQQTGIVPIAAGRVILHSGLNVQCCMQSEREREREN